MYLKVCFQDKYDPGVYGMQAFVYATELPLKIGDTVIAPTRFGDRKARVFEINLSEKQIDKRLQIKKISERYKIQDGHD